MTPMYHFFQRVTFPQTDWTQNLYFSNYFNKSKFKMCRNKEVIAELTHTLFFSQKNDSANKETKSSMYHAGY